MDQLYMLTSGINNVSLINITNNAAYDTVTVGNTPQKIAVTPDGTTIILTDGVSGNVSVIQNNVITTLPSSYFGYLTRVHDVAIGPGKITPTINWPKLANITYPTPLNKTQLDAQALDPTTGNPIDGTYVLRMQREL